MPKRKELFSNEVVGLVNIMVDMFTQLETQPSDAVLALASCMAFMLDTTTKPDRKEEAVEETFELIRIIMEKAKKGKAAEAAKAESATQH